MITRSNKSVVVDGKKVFQIPIKGGGSDMVHAGSAALVDGKTLFVGGCGCCHGHLYKLERETEDEDFNLTEIVSLDTNPTVVLPVSGDKLDPDSTVIIAGHGCSGAGVRLVNTRSGNPVEVVSTEEYNDQTPLGESSSPAFRVDPAGSIFLDFRRSGWRAKAGMKRSPSLPSILVDSRNEEYFVSSDVRASIDLTPRLRELGVDISKTIERLAGYTIV